MKSTMRSKKARRTDALQRIRKDHRWVNSKAFRTGSKTQSEWLEMKVTEAAYLESLR